MATVTDVTTAHTTGLTHIDALVDDGPAWNYVTPATNNTLTYAFAISSGNENQSYALTAFNGAQQAATRSLLAYVSSVTGIRFQETLDGNAAQWHFSMHNLPDPQTSGLCSWNTSYNYDGAGQITKYQANAWVYLDNVEWASSNGDLSAGGSGYETLLHEVGHALGLKHPFEGSVQLPTNLDTTANTVMSYTESGGPYSTYRPFDLATLYWLYGGDGLGGKLGVGSVNDGRYLMGSSAGERLATGTGNDILIGLAGNDTLDGGAGIDTAVFAGSRSLYTVSRSGDSLIVRDNTGAMGADTLSNIERLRFDDRYLNFDTDGTSGQVYRLYQAAFDRVPDAGGLGFWFHVIEDTGASLSQAAAGFMSSAEFKAMYGTSPSAETVISLFYNHVLHRQAEQSGFNYWVDVIHQGNPVADVLAAFAESAENQAQVIGTIQNGMEFIPYTG